MISWILLSISILLYYLDIIRKGFQGCLVSDCSREWGSVTEGNYSSVALYAPPTECLSGIQRKFRSCQVLGASLVMSEGLTAQEFYFFFQLSWVSATVRVRLRTLAGIGPWVIAWDEMPLLLGLLSFLGWRGSRSGAFGGSWGGEPGWNIGDKSRFGHFRIRFSAWVRWRVMQSLLPNIKQYANCRITAAQQYIVTTLLRGVKIDKE